MEPKNFREFICLMWHQREGLVNYLGMLLAQLGTSGLISDARAIAWSAFGAFALNQLSQHIRQFKSKKASEPSSEAAEQA